MDCYACAAELTKLKHTEGYGWLTEVDSIALQQSLRNLDNAYQNFFREVKKGGTVGFPRFKKKRDGRKK